MTTHFINGAWINGQGHQFQSINPAKNEVLWQGNTASQDQVDDAIQAARIASVEWAQLPVDTRLAYIQRYTDILSENKEAMSKVIAEDTGKPLWETATEVAAMVGKVAISERAFFERTGTVENAMPVGKAFIRHKPHGVVAVFGPYNFPGHLPNGHIIPALIAGNTVVFKPSELTPAVAQLMITFWQQAGLPNGVLNLVQGEIDTGKYLASHSDIDGLFFTGSSRTGKLLHEQFAGHPGKILALEMGGNNPLIVGAVENIDAAVHDIVQSAFITSGQRCTCARRLLLPKGEMGDKLLNRLIDVTQKIKVGVYDDEPQPFIGSMISKQAAQAMVNAQTELESVGGEILVKLTHINANTGLVTPGIIDMSSCLSQLPDEEHFGPLLKVIRYDSFDEAIAEANNTKYGLSAGLLSDNKADYEYFLARIRAGIVNWNRPITGASSAAPFGGIGESGNHRASAYYAADYCAYPVASVELDTVTLPSTLNPGLSF